MSGLEIERTLTGVAVASAFSFHYAVLDFRKTVHLFLVPRSLNEFSARKKKILKIISIAEDLIRKLSKREK